MRKLFKDPVLVIIFLPVGFLLLIALIVYVPRMLANPQYDFLYVDSSNARYNSLGTLAANYEIERGQLTVKVDSDRARELVEEHYDDYSLRNRYQMFESAQLYVYDVSQGERRKISIDEAIDLELSDDDVSPDGFSLNPRERNHYGVFELFGSSNSRHEYTLNKNTISIPVDLDNTTRWYSQRTAFIGWIINN